MAAIRTTRNGWFSRLFRRLPPRPAAIAISRCAETPNAIFYVLRSGCRRRSPPERFPQRRTTYRWFVRFRDDGLRESFDHHRKAAVRAALTPVYCSAAANRGPPRSATQLR
jgi:transposase